MTDFEKIAGYSLLGLSLYGGYKLIKRVMAPRENPGDLQNIYFLKRKDGSSWEIEVMKLDSWKAAKQELAEEYVKEADLIYHNDEFIDEIREFEDVDWYEGPGYYDQEEELILTEEELQEGIEDYYYDQKSYAIAREFDLVNYDLENSGELAKKRLLEGIENLGLEYEVEESRLSRSAYITVYMPDDEELEIRFSDHAAKPTYQEMHGYADYEVGDHDLGGSVENALEWLKEKLDE